MMRLLLAACLLAATPAAGRKIELSSKFTPGEVAWADGDGTASLKGSAFLRTMGGDIKTCAGLPVELVPASIYATERYSQMYGINDTGFLPTRRTSMFTSTDPAYLRHMRTTRCDAAGSFSFNKLPAGFYYLTATVYWLSPGWSGPQNQGGTMMLRLVLHNGEEKEVVLTQ